MPIVRKTVTVLFCDLVGSTALGDRADPELLREAMSGYHAALRVILERHGGTVEKFVGDAAMAVFGLPQVHEDDALRAVRAAAEIQQAVEALELEVRVGINTGEVVAGEGETLVTGDAVNVAARLEQAAEAGEILIGEDTERLVREAVRDESVEPLELKGKAEPVPAFRLLGVVADIPAFTRPIEAAFVGRKQELASLEAALATAVEKRQPRLVTIAGPPGIGKSRLARELIGRSQARVVVGRCLSYGEGITYWPLQEIIHQVGDLAGVLEDELARSRITAALGEGSASSDEIAWGFRRLFQALAQEQPLIVVLDDIHWAESTLLDLIEYVAAFAQDAPLLLLCNARPDLFELRPIWATPKPNATLLTLEPLPEEETEELVGELGHFAADAKARIAQVAEGNPLFVEQLVLYQAESRTGTLEIPPTIQALLAARIDRLEPAERAVIERASVEGRLFHRGSVQALLPESEREAVGSHLLTLVRKEFIRPDRSELPGDDGFRFGHVLIRDAAYDSLPKRLRAELHERFADWLEERMGDEAPDEIIGYHLEQTYRYGTELGHGDEEAARQAAARLADAGDRALSRADAPAALNLFVRAAALARDEDANLPRILEGLGWARRWAGEIAGAEDAFTRAHNAADRQGDRAAAARADVGWVRIRLLFGDVNMEELEAEATRLIGLLEEHGDDHALAKAWLLLGDFHNNKLEMAGLMDAAEHALEHARRSGARSEEAEAVSWIAAASFLGPEPVDRTAERFERILGAEPGPVVEAHASFALGTVHGMRGEIEGARALWARARSLYEETGMTLWAAAALGPVVGQVELFAGNTQAAESFLRQASCELEEMGERGYRSTIVALLAKAVAYQGRYDEAEALAAESLELGGPEDVVNLIICDSVRGLVAAARGQNDEAVEHAARAIERARPLDELITRPEALRDYGVALRAAGREDDAQAAFREALALHERKGNVAAAERVRTLLAA